MSQQAITADKVVSLLYSLKLDDGNVVDQSSVDEPLQYMHGKGHIIPGLESELAGKNVGEKLQVTVAPEQGYGPRVDDAVQEVPREAFPAEMDLQPGQQLTGQSEDGGIFPMKVLGIEGETVKVDLNHPLAGQTLHFDVEVLEVRDATAEEISHGHPHQEGGCGHDH